MDDASASRYRFLSRRRVRFEGTLLLLIVGTVFFWQFAPSVEDVRVPRGPTTQCSMIGCTDQVSLTVRFPDRRWPSGVSEVDIRLPDTAIHCRFSWPSEEPTGRIVSAMCDLLQAHSLFGGLPSNREETPVRVEMEPELASDLTGGEMQIVPQHFRERITITGTPAQVRVLQKLNGAVIGEQSFTFPYAENRPNGSLCGPICRQASAEWELRALPAVSTR